MDRHAGYHLLAMTVPLPNTGTIQASRLLCPAVVNVIARRPEVDAAIHHSLMDRHAGYHLLAMTVPQPNTGTAYKRSSSFVRSGECHCEEDFKSDAAIHILFYGSPRRL